MKKTLYFLLAVALFLAPTFARSQAQCATTPFQTITAGFPTPQSASDDIHIYHGALTDPKFPCFSAGPALRLSLGTGEFAQLSLIQSAGANSSFTQIGDVLLRSSPTAGDLILSTQNPTSRIRLITTASSFVLSPEKLECSTAEKGTMMRYDFSSSANKNDGLLYIKDKVLIGTDHLASGVHPPFQRTGSYMLAVKGSVLASELVIDARAVTWADFVFDPSYQLTPINTLEKEIQSLKHLPGIPSAKDVQENGIIIGDLQSKLLQKIEELTLYVIELKKENESLSKRVDSLEKSK